MFSVGFEKIAVSVSKVLSTVRNHREALFKDTGLPSGARKFDVAAARLIKSVVDAETLPGGMKASTKRAYMRHYIDTYRKKHNLLSTKQVNDIKRAADAKIKNTRLRRAGLAAGAGLLAAAGYGLHRHITNNKKNTTAHENGSNHGFIQRDPAYGLLSTSSSSHLYT